MQPHPAGPPPTAPQLDPLTEVPAPPPGPGVMPPFAAPPRDRDNKGLWIGLGVGGLVLVLCCVGGIFGVGMLAQGSQGIVEAQASSVTRDYLEALRRDDYPTAYGLLCTELTERFTRDAFELRVSRPKVEQYTIDEVRITSRVEVSTTVTRQSRGPAPELYLLVQEPTFRICGGV